MVGLEVVTVGCDVDGAWLVGCNEDGAWLVGCNEDGACELGWFVIGATGAALVG